MDMINNQFYFDKKNTVEVAFHGYKYIYTDIKIVAALIMSKSSDFYWLNIAQQSIDLFLGLASPIELDLLIYHPSVNFSHV
jgi:hypothetical protein